MSRENMRDPIALPDHYDGAMWLHGARCAIGPRKNPLASIRVTGGRLTHVLADGLASSKPGHEQTNIDLDGFLVLPGFINAHDHLQFSLFPKLANPPYRNYVDWGEDIHLTFPDVIAKHKSVSKDVRLWWGGIRNLLCGVTTVCHHDAQWPELQKEEFPVKVMQKFGWAHSLALGGDILKARSATPLGSIFVMHACEGIDDRSRQEIFELDRLGILDADTVLVHGLAIDQSGIALMQQRRASLIMCPSSNQFLFEELPKIATLKTVGNICVGSDSPLTATGDLLDEIRFAVTHCKLTPDLAYHMLTEAPAAILRLQGGEGAIRASGPADLIALRDTGQEAADRLPTLSLADVEFVMIRGRVQLASPAILERLSIPMRQGLEPLWIDGTIRWLRAPVNELLRSAEAILGSGEVRLGGKPIRRVNWSEAEDRYGAA
jgi:cytosine/adenosine deaminase-related metal-dependent hydrolase